MANKPKDYVMSTFKLRSDVAARLEAYKNATGVPKTFAIEQAVIEYLDRVAPDITPEKDIVK